MGNCCTKRTPGSTKSPVSAETLKRSLVKSQDVQQESNVLSRPPSSTLLSVNGTNVSSASAQVNGQNAPEPKDGHAEEGQVMSVQEDEHHPDTQVDVVTPSEPVLDEITTLDSTEESAAMTQDPNNVDDDLETVSATSAENNESPTGPTGAGSTLVMDELARELLQGLADAWKRDDFQSLKQCANGIKRLVADESTSIAFARENDVVAVEPASITFARECGAVAILIEIMKKYRDVDRDIVYYAIWAVSNIANATSENTRYVVNLGITPILRSLLDHSSGDVSGQACWCLGNIAGTSADIRDMVFSLGINDYIERLLISEGNSLIGRVTAAHCLANMCDNEPEIHCAVPLANAAVTYIQRHNEDCDVVSKMLLALARLSKMKAGVETIMATGVTFHVCTILLDDCKEEITLPGIQLLANICRERNVLHIQTALDHGMLAVLNKYASSTSPKVLGEVCTALGVLAASHSHLVLDRKDLVASLSEIVAPSSASLEIVRREASLIVETLGIVSSGVNQAVPATGAVNVAGNARFRLIQDGLIDSWNRGDIKALRKHLSFLRRFLFSTQSPPIKSVQESGMVPFLIVLMTKYMEVDHEIVYESVLALTNVANATCNDPRYLVNLGVLPVLRQLVDHSLNKVAEQAIICLNWIAMASSDNRDLVSALDITKNIDRFLIEDEESLVLRQSTVKLVLNLSNSGRNLHLVAPLVCIAATCVEPMAKYDSIHVDLVDRLAELSGSKAGLDAVLASGATSYVCKVALQGKFVTDSIYRILGNIFKGDSAQVLIASDYGMLKTMNRIALMELYKTRDDIRQEVWKVLNIIVTTGQVQLLLDDKSFIDSLSLLLIPTSEYPPLVHKRELFSLLVNICEVCSKDQAMKLATSSFAIHAFYLGTFHKDPAIHEMAWRGMIQMFEKTRCCATVRTVSIAQVKGNRNHFLKLPAIESSGKKVQKGTQNIPLAWFVSLRLVPEVTSDDAEESCSPELGFRIGDRTGLRLHQIIISVLLLSPTYFQRFRLKNGLWLPRELWAIFHNCCFGPFQAIEQESRHIPWRLISGDTA